MAHVKCIGLLVLCLCSSAAVAQDWSSIEPILGRKGVEKDGVYRVAFPRSDLSVTVQGHPIDAPFALTSWIAFSKMQGMAMCMGDFVVTDAELPEAQKRLLDNGFDITAVHNHLIGETPAVKYMHFSGQGDPAKLATGYVAALRATSTPLTAPAPVEATGTPPDWSSVEAIMKYKGNRNGRVLSFGVPRSEAILVSSQPLMPSNGAGSSVNFEWVDDKTVMLTSDLVLLASEIRTVVGAMHSHGITVTALHNHMIDDAPRTFHMHVFAIGDPKTLAEGMAQALSTMNVKRP